MKKIETGAARPETFPEQWPGQCEVFFPFGIRLRHPVHPVRRYNV